MLGHGRTHRLAERRLRVTDQVEMHIGATVLKGPNQRVLPLVSDEPTRVHEGEGGRRHPEFVPQGLAILRRHIGHAVVDQGDPVFGLPVLQKRLPHGCRHRDDMAAPLHVLAGRGRMGCANRDRARAAPGRQPRVEGPPDQMAMHDMRTPARHQAPQFQHREHVVQAAHGDTVEGDARLRAPLGEP